MGLVSSESGSDPSGYVQLSGMPDTESSTDPVESTPAEPERFEIQISGEILCIH